MVFRIRILVLVAALSACATGCAVDRGAATALDRSPEKLVAQLEAEEGATTSKLPNSTSAASQPRTNRRSDVMLASHSDSDDETVARGAEPESAPAASGLQTESMATAPAGNAVSPHLTLEYLCSQAVENHPLLRRDRARVNSAEGGALQAGLYPNPRFDTNNPQVFNGANSLFNAGVMQEFVVKGKRQLERAAALRTVQQAELGLMQDRYVLLTLIRSQFYTTLAAQVRVEVLTRLLAITEASLKTGKERAEVAKIATDTEALLLRVDYNKTLADLENARRILDGERRQLSALIGVPGLVQGELDGSLASDPPGFDEEILNRFVTEQHLQVQISKIEIEKNKVLLKRAEVEPYPNITLGPAYQWGLTKGNEQYWLTVTFPIPVADRNQGNIMAARANIRDATESLSAVQLELLRHVADSYSKYLGAKEQAERYKIDLLPDSIKALRLSNSAYRIGDTALAEYLQVQRTVIQTQKDYIDVLESLWTTAADLAGLLQMEQFP